MILEEDDCKLERLQVLSAMGRVFLVEVQAALETNNDLLKSIMNPEESKLQAAAFEIVEECTT